MRNRLKAAARTILKTKNQKKEHQDNRSSVRELFEVQIYPSRHHNFLSVGALWVECASIVPLVATPDVLITVLVGVRCLRAPGVNRAVVAAFFIGAFLKHIVGPRDLSRNAGLAGGAAGGVRAKRTRRGGDE